METKLKLGKLRSGAFYPHDSIGVGATLLPWSLPVKYLDLCFGQRVTWHGQVEDAKAKFLATRNTLLPLRAPRSPLVLLYISILRPVLVYDVLKALSTLQNHMLRFICGAHWCVSNRSLHDDLGIPPMRDSWRRHVQRGIVQRYLSIPWHGTSRSWTGAGRRPDLGIVAQERFLGSTA